MKKLSILVLLVIGLLVFVGCDGEIDSFSVEDAINITSEWGIRTTTEPGVSFLDSDTEDSTLLDMMDIVLADDPRVAYTVFVTSYSSNAIVGTYNEEMDEDDPYAIRIELSYSSAKLTLLITGEGPLAGERYHLEPAP